MPKLLLLVGPPGSGKSTRALTSGMVYVNQDLQGREGHMKQFVRALWDNQSVVVDRLNFSKEQREKYLMAAKASGYATEIVVLHESYSTCLNRCLGRKNHETIKTEKDAHSALGMFFGKYERVEDSEADVVTRVWPEVHKQPAIWVDMDNTLSDASHREHHLHLDNPDNTDNH